MAELFSMMTGDVIPGIFQMVSAIILGIGTTGVLAFFAFGLPILKTAKGWLFSFIPRGRRRR